jgi:small-conductance mechanosensitive channel
MNLLAVISNIAGRLTLTKILTSSAIIGFTQIIGLFILVPILTEAFYIQMKSRRMSINMPLKFRYDDIQNGLVQLLSVAAVFFWLITLATNLEIYGAILSFLDVLLNTPRIVGSTSFSIGNILTFLFILYIVSVLQKYVGYFFGETEDDFIGDLDKKESRLVIFRLIIIMVGFFIAVVASGLPVDKVTVVLGALGVGIGLGLQNIVYNLVSGVILIFEKPMQIGDYIEVADKKGRVQNIGIRASKLITSDGSEVIVPNGDILSSHMVNWTRSNNNRRTQLSISIDSASELQVAKDTILEELKKNHFVIQERPVEILMDNFTEKSVELSINVWINSIYKEQEFKSEVLSTIYKQLAAKGIKII